MRAEERRNEQRRSGDSNDMKPVAKDKKDKKNKKNKKDKNDKKEVAKVVDKKGKKCAMCKSVNCDGTANSDGQPNKKWQEWAAKQFRVQNEHKRKKQEWVKKHKGANIKA